MKISTAKEEQDLCRGTAAANEGGENRPHHRGCVISLESLDGPEGCLGAVAEYKAAESNDQLCVLSVSSSVGPSESCSLSLLSSLGGSSFLICMPPEGRDLVCPIQALSPQQSTSISVFCRPFKRRERENRN